MSLSCVIVDDEYLAVNVLKEYAGRLPELEIRQTFTDAHKALDYLRSEPSDILLLDINMPLMSGLRLLAELDNPPLIIFTTAHEAYAVEAFALDVLDYLLKPISFERFSKAIERGKEYLHYKTALPLPAAEERDHIMIRSDHRIVKIALEDIEYIEGLSEYVKVHTTGRMHITLAALKRLEEELPTRRFVRIHKSYIIARDAVDSFTREEVLLKSGKRLPVGRAYKDNIAPR